MIYNRDSIKQEWLSGKIDRNFTKWAEDFGNFLAQKRNDKKNTDLTTNQLRKFFGEVKRQQAKGYNPVEFSLLKPKLAYAVGKAKNKENKIIEFYQVLGGAIDKVNSEVHFKNFIKILKLL